MAAHVAGDEEMLADVLVPLFGEALRNRRIREKEWNLVGSPCDRISEHSRVFVNYL